MKNARLASRCELYSKNAGRHGRILSGVEHPRWSKWRKNKTSPWHYNAKINAILDAFLAWTSYAFFSNGFVDLDAIENGVKPP
jgi:hypothetical protein